MYAFLLALIYLRKILVHKNATFHTATKHQAQHRSILHSTKFGNNHKQCCGLHLSIRQPCSNKNQNRLSFLQVHRLLWFCSTGNVVKPVVMLPKNCIQFFNEKVSLFKLLLTWLSASTQIWVLLTTNLFALKVMRGRLIFQLSNMYGKCHLKAREISRWKLFSLTVIAH